MKRQMKGRKFGRGYDQRKALIKSVARALFLHEKIKTTEAKAKEICPFIEKIITHGKDGDVAAKRHIAKYFSQEITKKITEDIAPRYEKRNGGYTRIIKLGARKSDGAEMAIIELVK